MREHGARPQPFCNAHATSGIPRLEVGGMDITFHFTGPLSVKLLFLFGLDTNLDIFVLDYAKECLSVATLLLT